MKTFIFIIVIFTISGVNNSSMAAEISKGQQSLEFHGYFRSSLGFSKGGQTQAKFQLPGTRSKYRLGNEPDTSVELQFDYTYKLKNPENKNANIKSVIMIDGYKNLGESNSFSVGSLSQAYLSFNKFFNEHTSIWAGRRYYQRKSIHIMNHFWLNSGQKSHIGIGFENQPLNAGKLDLALFKNEDNFTLSNTAYLINSAVLDARWHDLNVTKNTKLTAWAQLSSRAAVPQLNYKKKSGYSLGGWLDYRFKHIKNSSTLMYQTGSAITQADFSPKAIREDQGWDLDKAKVIELNNVLTYETLPTVSLQWSLLYRQDDKGTAGNSKVTWLSTGIRPIYYLTKHTNVALEAGVDYIDDKINNRSGSLNKLTLAFQLAADRAFYSRPVLRLFATVANWDDSFKGLVGNSPGNAPYANDTSGWTIGAQAETWW